MGGGKLRMARNRIQGNEATKSRPTKAGIKIRGAYACPDPLQELDPQLLRFSSHGQEVRLNCCRFSDLSPKDREWVVDLTEENMRTLYEESDWGWNRKSKQKEFQHSEARLIMARIAPDQAPGHESREGEEEEGEGKTGKESGDPVGFVHFRFDLDEEGNQAVVYCYELQIRSELQRKGLGRHLMDILMQFAIRFKMSKVMLTCFRSNVQAMDFYSRSLGYVVDASSPSQFHAKACYEILSLRVPSIKRT
jgi:ribosomal protein S18 acetylase RimI-like enzyme